MARLSKGFEALNEDRESEADRERRAAEREAGSGGSANRRAGRRANPHRRRGAVRDSDIRAAERFVQKDNRKRN